MTLNIIADLRDALSVTESIAAVNRFDAETSMRLFRHLDSIVEDIEVLLNNALANTPALIAIGGPLVQHEVPPSAKRFGGLRIVGGAAS